MAVVRFDPFRTIRQFDRLADEMFRSTSVADSVGPAYDLEQHGEDAYIVRLAVPGYRQEDLEVSLHDRVLTVKGERKVEEQADARVIRRGIATGAFERSFTLGEHIEIVAAKLADGVLEIALEQRVPEALKPRVITIGAGEKVA